MKVLVTVPEGIFRNKFFNEENKKILENNFDVTYNELGRDYTEEELKEVIKGYDIIITGWGTPSFIDTCALQETDGIKMIAHTAGSIGDLLDDNAYAKGITVLSGNRMFAESVAEGTLGYMISSLRHIPDEVNGMRSGEILWKKRGYMDTAGLFDREVGIIGYGMISQYLMEMLKPFRCKIKIYSQFPVDEEFLKSVNAVPASLEEIFSTCSIISLHSALNEKTKHLITKEHFAMMQDGALFVNTARGAVVKQDEMIEELAKGRINAFLDVYTVEPLEEDSPLRKMKNVYLTPHRGGPTVDRWTYIGKGVIEDVVRFSKGEPLKYEISREYAARMTKNRT